MAKWESTPSILGLEIAQLCCVFFLEPKLDWDSVVCLALQGSQLLRGKAKVLPVAIVLIQPAPLWSHPLLLPVLLTLLQLLTHICLRAFVLAVPSTWDNLCLAAWLLPRGSCLEITSSERPSLTI